MGKYNWAKICWATFLSEVITESFTAKDLSYVLSHRSGSMRREKIPIESSKKQEASSDCIIEEGLIKEVFIKVWAMRLEITRNGEVPPDPVITHRIDTLKRGSGHRNSEREWCVEMWAEVLQHEDREPMMTLQGEEGTMAVQTLASLSLLPPDLWTMLLIGSTQLKP